MPRHSCQTGFCRPGKKKKNTDGEMKSLITSYHLHQQIQSRPSCWKAHIARRHGRNGHHGPGSISTSVSTGGRLSSTWVSKHHFPPATPRSRHCRQLLLLCAPVTFIGNDIWPDITWPLIVQTPKEKHLHLVVWINREFREEQRFRYLLHWLPL